MTTFLFKELISGYISGERKRALLEKRVSVDADWWFEVGTVFWIFIVLLFA